MTLPIPLTVRLATSRADRHIERDLRSLRFRSVAPGGFASASFSLDRPLASNPDEIAYYGAVDIYDARNGSIVWNGWLEDPGRGAGSDGQIWELTAIGPSAHVQDRTVPYVLLDLSGDGWEKVVLNPTERVDGEFENTASADGDHAHLRIRVPQGTTVNAATPQVFTCRYRPIVDAGMKLARVTVIWDAGFAGSTEWDADLVTRTGLTGAGTQVATADVTTAGGTLIAQVVTNFTNGANVVEFRLRRQSGNSTVGDGNVWLLGERPTVWGLRVNKSGTEITSSSDYLALDDGDIVEDLLGRLLPLFDGANAVVNGAGISAAFPHLAYPDGVTPGKVLDDVLTAMGDRYWAAWERQTNGRYRFEYVQWPTTVRYEADVTDGYSSQGSADGLFNRARVRFKNPSGAIQTVQVSQAVTELDNANRIRELPIDLGSDLGRTPASANTVGANQLAQYATPPNAGSLTIARPILDHDRGTMVQPWELRPGHLIRVRGIQPYPNALNLTGRDGVTVFRVISVEFDAASASATLELDSPAVNMARALSRVGRGEQYSATGLPAPFALGRR